MSLEQDINSQDEGAKQQADIERLTGRFNASVETVAVNPEKFEEMLGALKRFNPSFEPVFVEGCSKKTEVLVNVVAGIYAPLIHGFTTTILKNIECEKLPKVAIAPPRDAIPLAVSLETQAKIKGINIGILLPCVNRNVSGVSNNQKDGESKRSPYLDLLLDQTIDQMNGSISAFELETGIYGTTSMVMAAAFKNRKLVEYYPLKFYGLGPGPNLSYVHAILSRGQEWVAEKAEEKGMANKATVEQIMVLLDTMEELGMEKFYRSVEDLEITEDGLVQPVIIPVTPEELEVAQATNWVIQETALKYADMAPSEIYALLGRVPLLIQSSQAGMPFTLTEPIPSMDSKEEHFANIRNSSLFDYPELIL